MDAPRLSLLLLLLTFVALAVAQRPLPRQLHRNNGRLRVAGGALANRGQFPYQAGLILNGKQFCAGALIHEQYVLTTAVCVYSLQTTPELIEVRLGARNVFDSELEKGADQVRAQKVVTMVRYDPENPIKGNTLALVKLARYATLNSETIQKIDLPSAEIHPPYTDNEVTVTGWGYTGKNGYISYWLTFATPSVIQQDICQKSFPFVDDKIMCTRGKYNAGSINAELPTGPCLGDDGAPAVLEVNGKRALVGILSFMGPCESGAPSGFLLLNTQAIEWIKSILPAKPSS